jgi:hypothetical protein
VDLGEFDVCMYSIFVVELTRSFARGATAKSKKIVHKRLIGKTNQRRLKEGVEK